MISTCVKCIWRGLGFRALCYKQGCWLIRAHPLRMERPPQYPTPRLQLISQNFNSWFRVHKHFLLRALGPATICCRHIAVKDISRPAFVSYGARLNVSPGIGEGLVHFSEHRYLHDGHVTLPWDPRRISRDDTLHSHVMYGASHVMIDPTVMWFQGGVMGRLATLS